MSVAVPTSLAGGSASSMPDGPDGDAAWAAATRSALAQADADLAARFDRGDDVDALVSSRASAVDGLIRAAWMRCLPGEAGLALFAVGGYGRGELFPQSDIDVLVLADDAQQQAHRDALARFLALLWDAGLQASQAVRSPAQCTEAAADQTALTAMIESRALVADAAAASVLGNTRAPRSPPKKSGRRASISKPNARNRRSGMRGSATPPTISNRI
jgi:[protein-PII] uridylyltransferase